MLVFTIHLSESCTIKIMTCPGKNATCLVPTFHGAMKRISTQAANIREANLKWIGMHRIASVELSTPSCHNCEYFCRGRCTTPQFEAQEEPNCLVDSFRSAKKPRCIQSPQPGSADTWDWPGVMWMTRALGEGHVCLLCGRTKLIYLLYLCSWSISLAESSASGQDSLLDTSFQAEFNWKHKYF